MKGNNKSIGCFYLICFLFLFPLIAYNQTTVTIQPGPAEGKDARIWSLDPSSNFSNHQTTKINAWTWGGVFGIERSFIEFDLSSLPDDTEISEAKLSLYYHFLPGTPEQTHAGSNNLLISRLISAWSEASVTWNNQPSFTETNQVEVPPSSSPNQDYLNMDVTGMVQDAFLTEDKKCGFSFQMKVEETYRRIGLSSSDHPNSERWPKLEIIYTCSVDLGADTSFCTGDSIYITVGDDYVEYIWSNGFNAAGQWISEGGQYWVQVTDATECIASDTIVITLLPNPVIQLNLGPDIIACANEIITLDAGTGYENYLWNTGDTTQTIQILEDGVYFVNVSAECAAGSDTINITYAPEFDVDLGNDTLLCPGESFTLEPGFGFSGYLWQDGSTLPFYNVSEEGIYSVIVTDVNTCSAADDIIISYHEMNFDLGADTGYCENSSIDLVIDSTYSAVFWMDTISSFSYAINTEGFYWATVIDSLFDKVCILSDTIFVEAFSSPSLPQIPEQVYCCAGDSIAINGGVGSSFNYIWNNGSVDSIIYLSEPGSYEVSVFNSCDTVFTSVQLTLWPTPEIQIQLQLNTETGETFLFIDNFQNLAFWSTGSYAESLIIENPGTFWAEVENEYGCKSSDTIVVEPFDCKFKVPLVFTPNGDSYNSVFLIESSQIRKIQIQIFNRWGEKVFESTDPDFKWDGNRNGHPCAEGTYYWIILYNCKGFVSSDEMRQEKGTVMLLR